MAQEKNHRELKQPYDEMEKQSWFPAYLYIHTLPVVWSCNPHHFKPRRLQTFHYSTHTHTKKRRYPMGQSHRRHHRNLIRFVCLLGSLIWAHKKSLCHLFLTRQSLGIKQSWTMELLWQTHIALLANAATPESSDRM